jgi:hypothetical protein
LSNTDLEHNLQMNSAVESSVNADSDVTAPLEPTDPVNDEAVVNSRLDQQVDDAFREVEEMMVASAPAPRRDVGAATPKSPAIDWSTPNLVEPSTATVAGETDEPVFATPPVYELPPPDSAEEAEIRESLKSVSRRMGEIAEERQQAESKLFVRLETEAALQAEAFARRREEEELRRQTDEAAALRREEDDSRLRDQREQVTRTENDLRVLWAEERRLRSESVRLNQAIQEHLQKRARAEDDAKLALLGEAQRARDEAEEIHLESLARLHSEEEALRRAVTRFGVRRTELESERQKHDVEASKFEEEKARLAAATAARLAETTRLQSEAEDRLRFEQEHLAAQESELVRLREGFAQQRAELELARQSAEEDARSLAEARARMEAASESTKQAERERLLLEAEIFERAENERQMLEDVRSRAAEQQRQLEANAHERHRRETERLAEMEAIRIVAESNAQLFVEKEQILNSELASLQQAEHAMLVRIEEFEAQRTLANESYVRMVEKLKSVEDEAHARAAEEGQARVDLERRIKEETENLRRLEFEHKQRIDEEISRRVEAETRLQELKNRYQVEQAERIKAELQFNSWSEPEVSRNEEAINETTPLNLSATQLKRDEVEVELLTEPSTTSGIPVYQVGNLSSPDSRLRADAVTALARLGSQDSYDLIVNCFDDESSVVRNAAARAMLILDPERPVEPFTRALKEGSTERSARIGKAISDSGLATQAINTLSSDDRDETYNGLCLLLTMAKTGEVQPLVQAIETHGDAEVRLAAIRLLKLSGQEQLASAAVERRLKTKRDS